MTDLLDVVDVREPCAEPWEGMKGDARSRHCERCHLTVHNLTAMTREEALAVLRGASPPCVRFIRREDGTVLTRDCTPLRGPRLESVRAEALPTSGIPPVDLSVLKPPREALLQIPKAIARRLGVFPLRWGDGVLVVAVSGPPSRTALDELRVLTRCEVELALADEQALRQAIERAYNEEPRFITGRSIPVGD